MRKLYIALGITLASLSCDYSARKGDDLVQRMITTMQMVNTALATGENISSIPEKEQRELITQCTVNYDQCITKAEELFASSCVPYKPRCWNDEYQFKGKNCLPQLIYCLDDNNATSSDKSIIDIVISDIKREKKILSRLENAFLNDPTANNLK